MIIVRYDVLHITGCTRLLYDGLCSRLVYNRITTNVGSALCCDAMVVVMSLGDRNFLAPL